MGAVPESGFSGFSGFSSFSGFSGFSGFGGAGVEGPALAEALITNRDGIVGTRIDHISTPHPGLTDDPKNLLRLAPEVRSALYQSQLGTGVDVTFELKDTHPTATLWRRVDKNGNRRKFTFHPLVEMTSPTMEQLETQLKHVGGYAKIRQDRAAEIITQVGIPAPFFASIGFIDPARTPFTLEFLHAALGFSSVVIQRMKYALAVKRPIEFSPQIQPMIATPTHGSLPSGHSTEAFLVARLLWKLLIQSDVRQYNDRAYWGEMLMRQASRIATNRTVAGVHFPVDSVAGELLGLTLADHIHSQSCGGNWWSTRFDGPKFNANEDFDWHKVYCADGDVLKKDATSKSGVWAESEEHTAGAYDAPSPILVWLWNKALSEWRDLEPGQPV